MEYNKLPYSYDEQASNLLSKGLLSDKQELLDRLKRVSYFRLNAYFYPFKDKTTRNFKYPISLDKIWKHYTFDRQLRLIVLDAVERVEVAIRSQLLHIFAHRYGTFGYLQVENLPFINSYSEDGYKNWISSLKNETVRSREDFIRHFRNRYGDTHDLPPVWTLAEIMSYGDMLRFFNGVENNIRQEIAAEYKVSDKVLASWLKAIGAVRNICAHHGRLFNKRLGVKPLIPYKNRYPRWYDPFTIDKSKIVSVLTILNYMLDIVAPTSSWSQRFVKLMDDYRDVPQQWMGFPDDWQEHEMWKDV